MQLPLGIPLVYYYQHMSSTAGHMKQSPLTTCGSLRVDEFLEDLIGLPQAGNAASDEVVQPAGDRLGSTRSN